MIDTSIVSSNAYDDAHSTSKLYSIALRRLLRNQLCKKIYP